MSESMSICFAFLFGMIVAVSVLAAFWTLLPGTVVALLFTTLDAKRRIDVLDTAYEFFCDACGRMWRDHKDGDACMTEPEPPAVAKEGEG